MTSLVDGSHVAVVGGGPAGSFFALFLLHMARRIPRRLEVEIFEPHEYGVRGPRGCNMCGGVVSESLLQCLAAEGIVLPGELIQRRLDAYFLHTDAGSVRIATPLQEKRIAAVHRGAGPRTFVPLRSASFDGYLLRLAVEAGATHVSERVDELDWDHGRPRLRTRGGRAGSYDLLAVATGVNAPALENLDLPLERYEPPACARTWIGEFQLGADVVRRYVGSAMHVFLLDLPRLEFAAVIPKSDYVTVCLLGRDIDRPLVEAFLGSPEVQSCMPPDWARPEDFCRCQPRINVRGVPRPYGDRVVLIGDCATTRLYKDGIGAAYRAAKAAASTALFAGIAAADFERGYAPVCRAVSRDNALGRLVFAVTRVIRRSRSLRRGVWRMVTAEQARPGGARRMSLVLWDVFTGSASYRSVLARTLHPAFLGRFAREIATGIVVRGPKRPHRRVRMATGASGLLGKCYREGEVIYHQGERGDCMYVIQGGEVEIVERRGDKEYCLAVLGDGDFFGEMGLFEEDVRSATARAHSVVWIYTLEKAGLLRRIHEDPSLAFRIIERMSHRIRTLEVALVREVATR